jgi:hypothetical protein
MGLLGFSCKGTSVIPHFGHFPGASVTTSGCMTQVYFCGLGSAMTRVAPTIAIPATVINKNNFFICFLKID